jgi:transposase
MAYADDLRQKLLYAMDTRQGSQAYLAQVFGVSLSWVKGVVRRRRETGNSHALPHGGGRRPKLSATQRQDLQQYLTAHDDVLLRELQVWLETTHQVSFSVSSLSRLLTGMNWPRKKSHSTPPSGTPRPTSKSGKRGRRR